MAADSAGNDIKGVGVALSGFIGIAPAGTTIPTASGGIAVPLTLDAAFVKLGLVKTDGGPQLAWAADGDPIDFWQDGYSIPSGLATVTLAFTVAQSLTDAVRKLITGKTPDTNHYITVDGGGYSTPLVAWTEEVFKNGAIRRRALPNVTVGSATEDKNTRGEVVGTAIVLNVARSAAVGGDHWGEWVIPAP